MNKTGYFTISESGKRTHYRTLHSAALAADRDSSIENVLEVDRVLVKGETVLRERLVTTQAIDYLSLIRFKI